MGEACEKFGGKKKSKFLVIISEGMRLNESLCKAVKMILERFFRSWIEEIELNECGSYYRHLTV
jgi:hypothetical protein